MKNFYAVMKLSTIVTTKDILGKDAEIKISGCAGVIPVFTNKKEAVKQSHKGKYTIVKVQISQ